MDARAYLEDYSKKANQFLDKFFAQKEKEAAKISPVTGELVGAYREYMRGGKMARGALTVLGYRLAGEKDFEAILPVSVAIEIFHSFLLIHDDFIDEDKIRRGKLTIHEQYSQEKGPHFGASMAIVLGDAGAFLGYELIVSSNFSEKRKIQALQALNNFLLKTAYGEILDIKFDFLEKIKWKDVLLVRTYKTAYYTFVMPLSIGAILGGAPKKELTAIANYGFPVGIAFQLRDDILGMFGEKEKTGKSAESDIRQGKKTLLFTKALELARPNEQEYLLRFYGKKNLTSKQILKIKKTIKGLGALTYSQRMAKRLVEKGKKFVPQITDNPESRSTLYKMADYMIERES